ncbi:hypothetical protein Ddye_016252 [Dipteronia dyeriana]|uniref:ABC transmembrane type-1 domain-containing protein n=1 Tax=Dipteronia dyeriana TaxID=168575 RepID=A0AAD9U721_9ROSI|nr:hypothetical protein Ddye_016252 [Dipteronia dyeriana]
MMVWCFLACRRRSMCFEKVVYMEISWFDEAKHSSGAIGARLTTDAVAVQSLVGDALALLVQNIATVVAGLSYQTYNSTVNSSVPNVLNIIWNNCSVQSSPVPSHPQDLDQFFSFRVHHGGEFNGDMDEYIGGAEHGPYDFQQQGADIVDGGNWIGSATVDGPPDVKLHGSPASSYYVVGLLRRLSKRVYTAILSTVETPLTKQGLVEINSLWLTSMTELVVAISGN